MLVKASINCYVSVDIVLYWIKLTVSPCCFRYFVNNAMLSYNWRYSFFLFKQTMAPVSLITLVVMSSVLLSYIQNSFCLWTLFSYRHVAFLFCYCCFLFHSVNVTRHNFYWYWAEEGIETVSVAGLKRLNSSIIKKTNKHAYSGHCPSLWKFYSEMGIEEPVWKTL